MRLGLRHMRLLALGNRHIFGDKLLRGSATSSYDVHESFINKLLYLWSHRLWRFIVCAKTVRQTRIGISTNIIRCLVGKLLEKRLHLVGTKRAVQTDREYRVAAHTCKHSIESLSAQGASCKVAHGDAKHYRQLLAHASAHFHSCVDGSLSIKRVEHSLNEHSIHSTLCQRLNLLHIVGVESKVVEVACGRVAHVGTH